MAVVLLTGAVVVVAVMRVVGVVVVGGVAVVMGVTGVVVVMGVMGVVVMGVKGVVAVRGVVGVEVVMGMVGDTVVVGVAGAVIVAGAGGLFEEVAVKQLVRAAMAESDPPSARSGCRQHTCTVFSQLIPSYISSIFTPPFFSTGSIILKNSKSVRLLTS